MRPLHNALLYLGLAEEVDGTDPAQIRAGFAGSLPRSTLLMVSVFSAAVLLGFFGSSMLDGNDPGGTQHRPAGGAAKLQLIMNDPLVETHAVKFLGGSAHSYFSRHLNEAAVVFEDLRGVAEGYEVAASLTCGGKDYNLGNLAKALLVHPAAEGVPNYFFVGKAAGCSELAFTPVAPSGARGETVVLPIGASSVSPQLPAIMARWLAVAA